MNETVDDVGVSEGAEREEREERGSVRFVAFADGGLLVEAVGPGMDGFVELDRAALLTLSKALGGAVGLLGPHLVAMSDAVGAEGPRVPIDRAWADMVPPPPFGAVPQSPGWHVVATHLDPTKVLTSEDRQVLFDLITVDQRDNPDADDAQRAAFLADALGDGWAVQIVPGANVVSFTPQR